jgi:hypothetical protein
MNTNIFRTQDELKGDRELWKCSGVKIRGLKLEERDNSSVVSSVLLPFLSYRCSSAIRGSSVAHFPSLDLGLIFPLIGSPEHRGEHIIEVF